MHDSIFELATAVADGNGGATFVLEDALAELDWRVYISEANSEALLRALLFAPRWTDPELGVVPACEIISLAEETGLIAPIGSWVLETACRDAVAWQREDSPVQLRTLNLRCA